jgi:membrane associated rhomboid family serine protease
MGGTFHYQSEFRFFTHRDRITWAVQRLILLNTVVFAAQLLLEIPLGRPGMPLGGWAARWTAFQPDEFIGGFFWQAFTYQFLHGGLLHLFLNMLWLFFFGPEVERVLGTRQFVKFYLFCGAVGVLATLIPFGLFGRAVQVVGASGAVMGILVAFAMTNPEREFFLFPFPLPINARALVIIVIVLNVMGAMGGGHSSVATHFGGMASGYAYIKLIPLLRRWQSGSRPRRRDAKSKIDAVGEAVDNIFRFEDEKRQRK